MAFLKILNPFKRAATNAQVTLSSEPALLPENEVLTAVVERTVAIKFAHLDQQGLNAKLAEEMLGIRKIANGDIARATIAAQEGLQSAMHSTWIAPGLMR